MLNSQEIQMNEDKMKQFREEPITLQLQREEALMLSSACLIAHEFMKGSKDFTYDFIKLGSKLLDQMNGQGDDFKE